MRLPARVSTSSIAYTNSPHGRHTRNKALQSSMSLSTSMKIPTEVTAVLSSHPCSPSRVIILANLIPAENFGLNYRQLRPKKFTRPEFPVRSCLLNRDSGGQCSNCAKSANQRLVAGGVRSVLMTGPTGSGKVVAAAIMAAAVAAGQRALSGKIPPLSPTSLTERVNRGQHMVDRSCVPARFW
jgi:hypothetical protein